MDSLPQPLSPPPTSGVAALSPQYDLALSHSSRRSAPPIGSLSPHHIPTSSSSSYGPFPRKRSPQSTHHTPIAQDFLEDAAHAVHAIPSDLFPLSTTTPPPPHLQLQSHVDSIITADIDSQDIAFSSLDLGPPVFDNEAVRLQRHLSSSSTQPPPSLVSPRLRHNPSPSPIRSPQSNLPSLHIGNTSPRRHHATSPRDQTHPTRCILVRNIPPGIDDDEIRAVLQIYGPLRDLGAQQRARGGRGSVVATYYDVRHARKAVHGLDSAMHFGRRLDVRFQCPAEMIATSCALASSLSTPNGGVNQGTLVVFNLDNTTSAEEIRALFSTIGDVKEIRSTPNKKHHKFVEFYDVRDAERAMRTLNKTEVNGKRIKIEISRPGGRAGSLTRHVANGAAMHTGKPIQQQHHKHHVTQQPPSSQHQHIVTHQRHIHNQSSHLQYSADNNADTNYPPLASSPPVESPHASSPHIPFSLLNTINQAIPPPQLPSFSSSPEHGPAFDGHSRVTPISGLVGSTVSDASPQGRYAKPTSYENGYLNHATEEGIDYNSFRGTYDPLGEARASPQIPDQRASDLHRLYSNQVSELNGNKYGFTSSIMQVNKPRYTMGADSYLQALYSSPTSDGARPVSPTIDSAMGRNSFATSKHEASNGDVAAVNLYRRTFAEDCSGGSNGCRDVENVTSNKSFSNHSNHSLPSHQLRKLGGVMSPGIIGGDHGYTKVCKGAPSSSISVSGKHVSYSHSHQQQHGNAKYALDLGKVRSGEETRTALMIRNIPNKYNQKMLLSTLEENHRGHFDFIYLPIDFKNKCNVGYAFINLTSAQYIEPFYNTFHGKKWTRFNSEKVCEITFARIQGRQQLIAHFQNSSLLLEDPKCRPVIFDSEGRQEEFPIGSHVRTRRGPSNRDTSHRVGDATPPFSPTKQHRGRN